LERGRGLGGFLTRQRPRCGMRSAGQWSSALVLIPCPSPWNSKEGRTMKKFTQQLVNFVTCEDGPTAVEYAVMLALIMVVCIGAIGVLGNNANGTFGVAGNAAKSAAS